MALVSLAGDQETGRTILHVEMGTSLNSDDHAEVPYGESA